jgi:hypothetical protein
MLSRGTMAWFCLATLWLTALLVGAAAGLELRPLWALAQRLRRLSPARTGVGMVAGRIQHALSDDLIFASHTIGQIGRALASKRRALEFRDRSHESRVWGGAVSLGEGHVQVAPESQHAEVWTEKRARHVTSACDDASNFEAAYAAAKRRTGSAHTVTTVLREGDQVFVSGQFSQENGQLRVRATAAAPLLIAAADPRHFVVKRLLGVSLFIALELASCLAVTRLACVRPAFGPLSTLGACACLLFFLGVTPIGVWLRDWCRTPCDASLHGRWTEPPSAARDHPAERGQRGPSCHPVDSSASVHSGVK